MVAFPSSTNVAGTTVPPKPAMFHFNHDPTTPEQQAIWDWWSRMHEVDPQFEWKTAIAFYGVVIDQNAKPVPSAKVILAWNDVDGSHEKRLETTVDGAFELTNVKGKRLSVHVEKIGYVSSGPEANQSFEYAAFYEPNFHVPKKDEPVRFRLWKLENAHPLLYWRRVNRIGIDDEKMWFDITRGTFGKAGDVAFSTKRGHTRAPREFDWSLKIETAPGAGIAMSNEELMFEAPETGYQSSWRVENDPRKPTYAIANKVRFYLKTAEGKYAAIHAEIVHMSRPEAEIKLSAYVNPSGSRDLQYDPSKQINSQ
jgi:hypothetical protein